MCNKWQIYFSWIALCTVITLSIAAVIPPLVECDCKYLIQKPILLTYYFLDQTANWQCSGQKCNLTVLDRKPTGHSNSALGQQWNSETVVKTVQEQNRCRTNTACVFYLYETADHAWNVTEMRSILHPVYLPISLQILANLSSASSLGFVHANSHTLVENLMTHLVQLRDYTPLYSDKAKTWCF